jgi:hypothetical protein
MRDYKPRRCSKRWLDGDCPAQILAIIDHGDKELERFDVIYTHVEKVQYGDSPRVEEWLMMLCLTASGSWYHNEMQAHQVAAYRYRMKHRYAKWSTLPEPVKAAVRSDLAAAEAAL